MCSIEGKLSVRVNGTLRISVTQINTKGIHLKKLFHEQAPGLRSLLLGALVILLPLWLSTCASRPARTAPSSKHYPLTNTHVKTLASLSNAVEKNPNDGHGLFLLGMAYYKQRDFQEAAVCFQKAIKLDLSSKEKKEAYDKQAWSYYKMGEYDRAINIFEKAIKLYPDWNAPFRGMACALRQKGHYSQALKAFNQILADHPPDLMALDNRGWTYYLMKDYERALADFKKVAELSEGNLSLRTNVLNGQGWCHYMKGDFEVALGKFSEAIEIAPPEYGYGLLDGYRGMAFVNAALGKFEQAYRSINRATSAMKYDTSHDLALLYYVAGDKKRAWYYLGGPGYIGIGLQPISINGNDILYVATVDQGGPAEKAGILPGDIIVNIEGHGPADLRLFGKTVKSATPGTKLMLVISRNGVDKGISVTIGSADQLIIQDRLLAPIFSSTYKTSSDGMDDPKQ